MNTYADYRLSVIGAATAQGVDEDQATKAWDAIVQEMQTWHGFASLGPQERASTVRKRQRALRKKACGAIGITILGLLISALVSKAMSLFLDWLIDTTCKAVQDIQPHTTIGREMYGLS